MTTPGSLPDRLGTHWMKLLGKGEQRQTLREGVVDGVSESRESERGRVRRSDSDYWTPALHWA